MDRLSRGLCEQRCVCVVVVSLLLLVVVVRLDGGEV